MTCRGLPSALLWLAGVEAPAPGRSDGEPWTSLILKCYLAGFILLALTAFHVKGMHSSLNNRLSAAL